MPIFKKKESKKDKELLKKLINKRDLAKKYRESTGWDDRCTRAWNYYYYGTAEDLNDATLLTKKKRYANYVFSNIESIIPKIFDRFPGFQVLPRGEEDVEKAPVVEDVLKYKTERAELEDKYEYTVRDMLVPGFGVLKITWGFVGDVKGDDVSVEEDDVRIETIDPKNFWITAGDSRLGYADGCFERMYVHPEVAEKRYGKKLKPEYTLVKDQKENLKGEAERCIIWQYSGRIGDKVKMWTFTDEELLSTTEMYEHGQKPYVILPNYRTSTEFYGLSEVFEIEPLQEALTEIDKQFSQFRKRAINPKKFVKTGALDEINMSRLKDPRINVIEMKEPGGVAWEQPGMIGQDLYNIRLNTKEDIGLITGQSEISRGGTERTVKTATGQQILFDAAQSRVRQKTRALKLAVKQTLTQIQGLMAQYMDKEDVVKMRDGGENPFAKYTKEDIQGNFDYLIDMVEAAPFLREKRGQLSMEAYRMFKDDPDVDQKALKKKVLKTSFGDINAEELVLEEPQAEEIEITEQGPPMPPMGEQQMASLLGNVPLQQA